MTTFEFIQNWTRRFRLKTYHVFIALWSFLSGKFGLRRKSPESLPDAREAAQVVVSRDPAEAPAKTVYADTADSADQRSDWELKTQTEIDFGRLDDLEAFAEEMTVPKETIQRWIAAGILTPVEIRVAERLVKIMRDKDRKDGS